MHQDQRIGLALGVLLIGACAAFFFRNETRSGQNLPRLQHAQQLDQRIAEKATRPYLKGIEAIEAADRKRSETSTEPSSSFWSLFNSRSAKTTIYPSLRDHTPPSSKAVRNDEELELDPITVSIDDHPQQNSVPDSPTVDSRQSAAQAPNHEQTHVVQKGETLTSIATRTLGNPSRYHELFEANTDQLVDPNDVKPGMVLRIPSPQTSQSTKPRNVHSRPTPEFVAPAHDDNAAVPESTTEITSPSADPEPAPRIYQTPSASPYFSPPSQSNDVDRSNDSPTTNETAPKRFVPVPRNPHLGRPADSEANSRSKRGRRLTQVQADPVPSRIAR